VADRFWLYVAVTCDKCGIFMRGDRRGELRVVVHDPYGCERDGQVFEAPSIELRSIPQTQQPATE
jgi:hypothetical protein